MPTCLTLIDKFMHDPYAETSVGLAHDPHVVHEEGVASSAGASAGDVGKALAIELSMQESAWNEVNP